MDPSDRQTVEALLSGEAKLFTHELGGLEFYGASREFQEVLNICRDLALGQSSKFAGSAKVYLFIPTSHGKSSLTNAMAFQASINGTKVSRFDGTQGETSRRLKDLQSETDVLVIVDGVPESSHARSTLLERFNSLRGKAVLLARSEYSSDASLLPDAAKMMLAHVDERYSDKVAWILGSLLESLRDETGSVPEHCLTALRTIPAGIFATLCRIPLGTKVANIGTLSERIAQAVQLGVSLGTTPVLSHEDMATIFADFHWSAPVQGKVGFRLWVEGESDARLLGLVCRLARTAHGIDLAEGLTIVPLGLGREGGTSKITEIVISHRTARNRDVFLLDSDEPGRHALKELEVLNQDALLLDNKLACGQMGDEVEIEDLINVGCLDRFYSEHSELRPEREIIRYKPPMSRRLVINGTDKEMLIGWLEQKAELRELENVMFMLCEARSRFSLRNLPDMRNKQAWKRRLVEEPDADKRLGRRPDQWIL